MSVQSCQDPESNVKPVADEGGVSHLCRRATRKPAAMDLSSGRQTQPAGAAVSRAAARSAAGRTPRVHMQQMLLHAGPHVPLRRGDRPSAGAVPRASAQTPAGARPSAAVHHCAL